jgi:hypothetical protein
MRDLPEAACVEIERLKTELGDARARILDLDERVLILEAQMRQPLSIVDLAIAAETAKRRYERRFLRPLSPLK